MNRLLPMLNESTGRISFYIVAHADDWQLFMQPNAYNDLIMPDSKVVFIITTAGDAGKGAAFWQAREEGLKSSVRFCKAPLTELSETNGNKEFNSHRVHYWSVNNVTCYFLRLPDGGLEGKGFTENNYQSLYKFSAGEIDTIIAIDQSTAYLSWLDICTMLQAIILEESAGISQIRINYLHPDTTANPNDHPDHMATGKAIRAMPNISRLQQVLFVGYNSRQTLEKLSSEYLFWKAGMLAAYEKAVYDSSGYSTLSEDKSIYMNWCLSSARFTIVDPVSHIK